MDTEQPTERSIWLWPEGQDDFRPWLDPYPVGSHGPRGAVLICPGGGYAGRARHEGIAVAERLNEAGLNAFVVHYRVAPHRHPAPLRDASRAIRMIRDRAEEWKVGPDRIAILGFSAGGHLAGSLGVHHGDPDASPAEDDLRHISNRPDALILCYAVLNAVSEFAHRGSMGNLLGPDAPEEMLRKMSLELHVTENTPPTFLWHTAEDPGVKVENSLLFAEALSRHGVPFELHVYPEGRHGLGLAPEDPHVATWMDLCCEWLKGMGW
ncbi:MAG: alpha/beta hydrolase [Planctomycetes bacterium]|nr:alpha/beta hydrolase [Planctomycetota bacterium]